MCTSFEGRGIIQPSTEVWPWTWWWGILKSSAMELDCGLNSHSRFPSCMTFSQFLFLAKPLFTCKTVTPTVVEMTTAHQKFTQLFQSMQWWLGSSFPDRNYISLYHVHLGEAHMTTTGMWMEVICVTSGWGCLWRRGEFFMLSSPTCWLCIDSQVTVEALWWRW